MFYWVLKTVVLGPVLKLLFRPWVEGEENIPDEGPAILASNHLSFSDSIFLPLVVQRRVTFLAKSDYFTGRGIKGRLTAAFFKGVGQLPVDRSGGRAGEAALRSGLRGAAPRRAARASTPRAPARPTAASTAAAPASPAWPWRPACPVLPVAMIGTDKAQPTGKKVPKIMRIGVRIGQAAGLLPLRGHGGRPFRPALDHRRDHVRADAPVRPGVRRHVRHLDEGPDPRRREDQGTRAAGGGQAGHRGTGARGGAGRRRRREARQRPGRARGRGGRHRREHPDSADDREMPPGHRAAS